MNKFFAVFIIALLLLVGCAKESGSKETEQVSPEEEVVAEGEENNDTDEKMLYLENIVEQLGGESFTEEGLNSDSHITDKDGYTYVISPAYGYTESFKLNLSILKDNKFIVKEKLIDFKSLLDIEWDRVEQGGLTYDFFENNVLIKVEDFTVTSDDLASIAEKLFTITVNPDGQVQVNKVAHTDLGTDGTRDTYKSLVKGFKGAYFQECSNSSNQCKILSYDGTTMFTFDKNHQHFNLLDESKGRLYFQENDGLSKAFDLKANDFIWDSNGAEKLFNVSRFNNNISSDYGLYSITTNYTNESNVYYFTNEEEVELGFESYVNYNLPSSYQKLTLDDKYFNIYTIVEYKGKPTIQKYSFTRVDIN